MCLTSTAACRCDGSLGTQGALSGAFAWPVRQMLPYRFRSTHGVIFMAAIWLYLVDGADRASHCAKFSSSKTQVFSCGDDSTVRLWDLPTEEEVTVFRGHEDYVRCGVRRRTST